MSRPKTKDKHLPRGVTIIHGSFWYKPTGQKRVRVGPVNDEAALYRFMADKLTPAGPMYTVRDMLDRYTTEVLPTLEPRTQKDYRRHLKVLAREFGAARPEEVLPKHIGMFLTVTKGKIQRNRIIAVLSAVYTKAVGRWYVAERNPCIGVERNPSKKRDRYVSDQEYAAVYALHGPRMQIAMDLALLTGQRQGDLLRLPWSKVTPEGVEFKQGKTGKRLLVMTSPDLEAVLERAREMLPHLPRAYVLRRRDGQPYSENGFRAIWQRTMRKHVKAGGERFTFHDLRAKSASDSVEFQKAYERLGHTSPSMTRAVYDRGIRKVTPLR